MWTVVHWSGLASRQVSTRHGRVRALLAGVLVSFATMLAQEARAWLGLAQLDLLLPSLPTENVRSPSRSFVPDWPLSCRQDVRSDDSRHPGYKSFRGACVRPDWRGGAHPRPQSGHGRWRGWRRYFA